jgi:hypothetical protein
MRTIRYVLAISATYRSTNIVKLNLQMVAGLTFPYYSESRITFNPTYKYDIGEDRYDTS